MTIQNARDREALPRRLLIATGVIWVVVVFGPIQLLRGTQDGWVADPTPGVTKLWFLVMIAVTSMATGVAAYFALGRIAAARKLSLLVCGIGAGWGVALGVIGGLVDFARGRFGTFSGTSSVLGAYLGVTTGATFGALAFVLDRDIPTDGDRSVRLGICAAVPMTAFLALVPPRSGWPFPILAAGLIQGVLLGVIAFIVGDRARR